MNEDAIEMNTGALICKGIVGTVTPALGLIISNTSEMETWLRITSLIIGIAVGIATLISILKKGKKT